MQYHVKSRQEHFVAAVAMELLSVGIMIGIYVLTQVLAALKTLAAMFTTEQLFSWKSSKTISH